VTAVLAALRGMFLREGGIVEYAVHKIVHRCLKGKRRLAEMHQLRCAVTHDMRAQRLPGLTLKQGLQLTSGDAPVMVYPRDGLARVGRA